MLLTTTLVFNPNWRMNFSHSHVPKLFLKMKYESANKTIKMIVCHICINVLRIKLKINAITKITITKTTPNMPEDANLRIKFPNPAVPIKLLYAYTFYRIIT